MGTGYGKGMIGVVLYLLESALLLLPPFGSSGRTKPTTSSGTASPTLFPSGLEFCLPLKAMITIPSYLRTPPLPPLISCQPTVLKLTILSTVMVPILTYTLLQDRDSALWTS